MTNELTVEAKMHAVIADIKRCIDTEGLILQAYEKLDYLDRLVQAIVPEVLERAADIADVMSIAPWGGDHESITPKHLASQIAAAIRKSAPEQPRNVSIRRQWENAALDIVVAVKRNLVPDMDDNDGGELLSWILNLVEKVAVSAPPQAWQGKDEK